jgi:hypothetical protein
VIRNEAIAKLNGCADAVKARGATSLYHQTVGNDEVKADCVAVQRGRKEGWLTASGLEQVCEFMRPARQDRRHFSGVQRCEFKRRCFVERQKNGAPLRST